MSDKMNIPSPEEFARASRLTEDRFRSLDRVRASVLVAFTVTCPLHDFRILPQGVADFRAYVFFKKRGDIEACHKSGVTAQIEDYVYAELERVGRGKRADIKVAFEFDSDEDVSAEYGGDYFLRLR
ncbi:MAG TPA: hypothetical protein PK280_13410 [Planctomycetota bacterium]|nr:hypothetical protein [Planctomycetota bacterium]